MKHLTSIVLALALLLGQPIHADQETSSTKVCGRTLALFVIERLYRYAQVVIREKTQLACAKYGVDPVFFSRIYGVRDIFQEVEMAFLNGDGFDPGFHDGDSRLRDNNHLKKWLVNQIRWQVGRLVWKVRKTVVLAGESQDQADFIDPLSLRSVLDRVAEESVPGDRVESSIPELIEKAGISTEQWKDLLTVGPRWIENSCAAHGLDTKQFWSSTRGYFTVADFAEELLLQSIAWQQRFGPIDRPQAVNAVVEVTAQKMVEEVIGFLSVRELTLKWMSQKGKTLDTAARNYRRFFIEGEPTDVMMEKEDISKGLVSFRKKSCQESYDEHAKILIQYPESLWIPSATKGEGTVNSSDYLRIIVAVEKELKANPDPQLRIQALRNLVPLLRPHLVRLPGDEWQINLSDHALRNILQRALKPTPR